jgi:hypothetical protein
MVRGHNQPTELSVDPMMVMEGVVEGVVEERGRSNPCSCPDLSVTSPQGKRVVNPPVVGCSSFDGNMSVLPAITVCPGLLQASDWRLLGREKRMCDKN